MSSLEVAAAAVGAGAMAWAAIYAVSRLDLARWVWLPAFRTFGALSVGATGLLLLGAPVPLAAPAALALLGVLAGLAGARWRARAASGGAA